MTIISGCYFIYCLDLHADINLATGTVHYHISMCILVQNMKNVYSECLQFVHHNDVCV